VRGLLLRLGRWCGLLCLLCLSLRVVLLKKQVTSVSYHSRDGEGAVKYVVVVSDLLLNIFQTHDVDLYF
jgi:hypothetical protein